MQFIIIIKLPLNIHTQVYYRHKLSAMFHWYTCTFISLEQYLIYMNPH